MWDACNSLFAFQSLAESKVLHTLRVFFCLMFESNYEKWKEITDQSFALLFLKTSEGEETIWETTVPVLGDDRLLQEKYTR